MGIYSYGVSLKFSQKVAGYPPNSYIILIAVVISCLAEWYCNMPDPYLGWLLMTPPPPSNLHSNFLHYECYPTVKKLAAQFQFDLRESMPKMSSVFSNMSLLFNSGEESLREFPVQEECTGNYPTFRNGIFTSKPVTLGDSIIHLCSISPVKLFKKIVV